MQVITKVLQGKVYDGYFYKEEKGFVEVTQCNDCEMTGYSLDLRVMSPCPNCGGRIKTLSEPAKIVDGKWQIRTGFTKEDKPATPEFYEKNEDEEIIEKESFFARYV